jgi:hypothetical protein
VLFQGVRALSAEAIVLRCNPLRVWHVATPLHLWRDWHLVSVLPPFFLTIVMPPTVGSLALPVPAGSQGNSTDINSLVSLLRVLGCLDVVFLVFGVPFAVSRFSTAGLIVALGSVLIVSVIIATISAMALMELGLPSISVIRKVLPLAWPFSSPLAAELVLSLSVRHCARLVGIAQLLDRHEFRSWIRPFVYDVNHGRRIAEHAWLEEVAISLSKTERTSIANRAPVNCQLGECYCPRCGKTYRRSFSACSDCIGVFLKRA